MSFRNEFKIVKVSKEKHYLVKEQIVKRFSIFRICSPLLVQMNSFIFLCSSKFSYACTKCHECHEVTNTLAIYIIDIALIIDLHHQLANAYLPPSSQFAVKFS